MAELTNIQPPKPPTSKPMINLIRGLLDTAFKQKITYLEITYKTKEAPGKVSRLSLDVG